MVGVFFARKLALGFSIGVATAAPLAQTDASQLPVVDLGYELHQALSYDSTNDFYRFQNIRYARSPVGDLRFRAPQPPIANRSQIFNGSEPRFCPQGCPMWQEKAIAPIAKYSAKQYPADAPFNLSSWVADIASSPLLGIPWNKGTTEDCLFLDVSVPLKTFQQASQNGKTSRKGAPVLIWIHGGGFALGAKTQFPRPAYDPKTLLKYAQEDSSGDGLVFVALNYRLGALGFLAGPDVAANGTLNAGLLDQRMALDWVQTNIHLFGGDPDRVTVMGESGGAASVLLQLTGYGAKRAPFKQAITQSPGIIPPMTQRDSTYTSFMATLNVSDLAEARKLPSQALIDANAKFISTAPPGSFYFLPVIDGSFIPARAEELMRTGRYDKSVKVMSSVNSFEGGHFFDPTVKTEADYRRFLAGAFPALTQASLDEAVDRMYPPVFDGSLGYTDQNTRQMAAAGEALFYCNEELVTKYLSKDGYSYQFSIPPGVHTQDTSYTLDNPSLAAPVPYPAAQEILQRAVVSFSRTGVPSMLSGNGSKSSTLSFPRWDPARREVFNITTSGAQIGKRVTNQTRCDWWVKVGGERA